jgi:DNA-directed RNA polymerase specialized sigma24 family protein
MTPPTPETDELKRLEQAIANLPRMQRHIFLAKCRDGQTYAVIAARTRLTRKGVQARLAWALYNIRRQLDGERLGWWQRWF